MPQDYKSTLNLPKSSFPMKGNLQEKEMEMRQYWQKIDLYQILLQQNSQKAQFVLHDGPPYANGDIHVGTALNKILKDVIVRYKTMSGFLVPYIPGWDTHGLPIENKMLKKINKQVQDFDPIELREKARLYALEQVANQKQQFEKLNLLTDFKKIYLTMDKNFEANQLKLFKKMLLDGLIYKGLKPIYWSPSSQSALAEAEIEYLPYQSPSIFFIVTLKTQVTKIPQATKLIIWTTTPWTLIANAGIAIAANFKYCLIKVKKQHLIVAKQLLTKVATTLGFKNYQVVRTFLGKELEFLEYYHPLFKEQTCPIVLGTHIKLDAGTGLVHLAPLFGEEDFILGQKYNLKKVMHINDNGVLNYQAKQFAKTFYLKANLAIINYLKNQKNLLRETKFNHSYPHDWRTNQPIIYRAIPQWFVDISKIKPRILIALKKVSSIPSWGVKKLEKMIQERDSWTISRQRHWGVPIPIFYHQKKPVINETILDNVIDLVQKHGTDIWWQKNADQLLPKQFQNKGYLKETDIMDVWFDSGTSAITSSIVNPQFSLPYQLYFEGVDQYRGWFNSSLINTVAYYNQTPYQKFISHGFVVDKNGFKMSKSKNNLIYPQEIIDQYGAEILRLWACNCDFTNDIVISNAIIKQNVDLYRNFRIKLRFLHGNLNGFNSAKRVKRKGFHLYIAELHRQFQNAIITAYQDYEFEKVIKTTNKFILNISSYYLEFCKDLLYADSTNSLERRMIQTNLWDILNSLIITLAPILPVTSEEMFQALYPDQKSIHLKTFFSKQKVQQKILSQWKPYFKLLTQVNQILEIAIKNKKIKRRNEAEVTIVTKSKFLKSLNLTKLLIVGKVIFGKKFEVTKFDSNKCLRCWNHFTSKTNLQKLCARCFEVINHRTN